MHGVLLMVALVLYTSAVEVRFLLDVQRFTIFPYIDNYFTCNVVGQTLQWEVNQTRLGGFDVGSARALTSSKSNFNYTSNLLSSQPLNGQFSFASVLVVSISGTSTLDVVCRNEVVQNSTSNRVAPLIQTMNIRKHTDSVYLHYILTKNIISSSTNLYTSIFICGVQNVFQTWQVERSPYGFDTSSKIGDDRLFFLSQDRTVVNEQAILIARVPYQIVSILFITDTSDIVNVTCSGDVQVMLSVNRLSTSTECPTMTTSLITEASIALSSDITGSPTFGKSTLLFGVFTDDISITHPYLVTRTRLTQ